MSSKPEKAIIYKLAFFIGLLSFLTIGCSEGDFTVLRYPGFVSFDTDNEGWHISEGGIGNYSATGGNPGGYLIGTDNAAEAWYFIASKGFVNEVKKNYSRTLSFDLEQSANDFQVNTLDDIILTDGSTTLTFDTAYNPKTTWTHYMVKLDAVSGWKKGSLTATKEELMHVLQNLTDLRIRGEFRAGPDRGGLDNVTLY